MTGNLLGCALRQNLSAAMPTFRTEVDDPVGGLDDIQIVLDHDDRIAMFSQAMQHTQ